MEKIATLEQFEKFIDKLISYKDTRKSVDEFKKNGNDINNLYDDADKNGNSNLHDLYNQLMNKLFDAYPELMRNPEKYSTSEVKIEKLKKLKDEIDTIQRNLDFWNKNKDSPNNTSNKTDSIKKIKELTKRYHEKRIELLKWTIDETQIKENHFKDYDSFVNS